MSDFIGLSLEKVERQVVGKDSDQACQVLKNFGFAYVESAYPVVVWRRGVEWVEVSYRSGRVSQVRKQG